LPAPSTERGPLGKFEDPLTILPIIHETSPMPYRSNIRSSSSRVLRNRSQMLFPLGQSNSDTWPQGRENCSSGEKALKSSPYSPRCGFRHGNIVLCSWLSNIIGAENEGFNDSMANVSKENMNDLRIDRNRLVDENGSLEMGMDWTAFHMTASGLCGLADNHLVKNRDEMAMEQLQSLEVDENMTDVNDIIEWWLDFGLDSGRLSHHHATTVRKKTMKVLGNRADELFGSDGGGQLPLCGKPYNETITNSNINKEMGVVECHTRRSDLGAANESKGNCGRYERRYSEFSPPPSPMEIVSPGRPGFVPMGSNLNHDLKDFLKWKIEHVEDNI
jgi:hypothetical protein